MKPYDFEEAFRLGIPESLQARFAESMRAYADWFDLKTYGQPSHRVAFDDYAQTDSDAEFLRSIGVEP